MKLGARILKTGIAIVLALYVAMWLDLPSPVFAGIAAVFAIQPTVYRSYLNFIEQLQANVIGAAVAILFGLIFGHDPFIVGLAVIVVIGINLKLKTESTISVAIVTVIAIMSSPVDDFLKFSIIRLGTILLGVVSASLVNLVFIPPKYESKLYQRISDVTEEIIKWIRVSTRHATEYSILKEDIEKLKENVIKLDSLYLLYKEERNYFKNNKLAKSRKLVLFRQLIVTTHRALDTLKKLHRLENEIQQIPESFQHYLKTELDNLLFYHEQVLLKFVGKIKAPQDTGELTEIQENNKILIDTLFNFYKHNEESEQQNWYHMFQLVSTIVEYSEQIDHLNTLIDSFQNYHKDENELEIS